MIRWLTTMALCGLVAGNAAANEPAPSATSPAGDAVFRAATEREAAGDVRGAANLLIELADQRPDDALADEALMKAARLFEEHLSQPARAVELYRRVLRDYPASRLGRRAQVRIEAVQARLGPGNAHADALAEFQRIQREYPDNDPLDSIAAMERLIAEHPSYPGRGEAFAWVAAAYERHGWLTEAVAAYRQAAAEFGDTGAGRDARKAVGDVLLARGDFAGAEAAYRSLLHAPDYQRAVRAAMDNLALERSRARLLVLAWVGLALFVAGMLIAVRRCTGSWSRTARALLRPPAELLYLAPVASLLVLSSLSINELVGTAIIMIAVGALLVTWLSGVALDSWRRSGRLTGPRALAQAAASAAAVVALIYIAVKRERVLDMILETWRHGPDPG